MDVLFMHNLQVIGVDEVIDLNLIEKEIKRDFSFLYNYNSFNTPTRGLPHKSHL